jgi:hypothetical protein
MGTIIRDTPSLLALIPVLVPLAHSSAIRAFSPGPYSPWISSDPGPCSSYRTVFHEIPSRLTVSLDPIGFSIYFPMTYGDP